MTISHSLLAINKKGAKPPSSMSQKPTPGCVVCDRYRTRHEPLAMR